MKPFNPKAVCPKCGGKKITYEYCGGILSESDLTDKSEEFMYRECGRCGYYWREGVKKCSSRN